MAYAEGDYLDHLGILTDTVRLTAKPARAALRFIRESGTAGAVLIPAGTRVSPDGRMMFRILEPVQIEADARYVDAPAECEVAGTAGNGLLPGQIDKPVDLVAGVASVANIETSLGGTDVEHDDNFRERIRLSVGAYAEAGPTEAYRYWARSAHQDIVDVAVVSPEPGVVEVRPLMAGGEKPGQEILDLVVAALDPERVVPLTDTVRVLPPEAVTYSLDVTYYIGSDRASISSLVKQAAEQAVADWIGWQCGALGRDINPDALTQRLREAGVKRAVIDSPVFTTVPGIGVAQASEIRVIFGGTEEA